jgi:hypothetical protein
MTWHLAQLALAGGWTAGAICLGYWLAIYGEPADEVEVGRDGGPIVGTRGEWDWESVTHRYGTYGDTHNEPDDDKTAAATVHPPAEVLDGMNGTFVGSTTFGDEMDVHEFAAEGYLQEINRRFLHPLGLAIEVGYTTDGVAWFDRIWDYRDDPEGLRFVTVDYQKASNVVDLWAQRQDARVEALGYMIQPVNEEAERAHRMGDAE